MEISAKNARVRPCIEIQIRNIEANCWLITQMYMFLLTIRQQRAHKKWAYWKNKLTSNRLKFKKCLPTSILLQNVSELLDIITGKRSKYICILWVHYHHHPIILIMERSLGGTTIERLSREFSGRVLKSHWGQLFIATSKNLSVVNTICITSFRYTQVIPQGKFDWNKCGDSWRQWLK